MNNFALKNLINIFSLKKSFNKGEHPRDESGKFTNVGNNSKNNEIEKLKSKIKRLFQDKAIPLPNIPFTRENYNKLFPRNRINTPLGSVKMGEHQFEKLQALKRDYLLGAVHETLKNPLAVILENRNDSKSKLYVKSFFDLDKNKQRIVQSVVVDIDGDEVSISTHERNLNNVLGKIKTADAIIYTDKNTRRMTEQSSSINDGSVVSPTKANEHNSYQATTSLHNIIKKSSLNKTEDKSMSKTILTNNDKKVRFESIKKKVIEHLEKVEEEENKTLKKSFMFALLGKGGKGLPVGTIREWKGKKFIKVAPGKWRPKYDSHTKGAKLAISALKKKIVACKDEHEMMQIILENRDRFTDSRGNPLPFVQELYKFIIEEQNSEKRLSPDEAHRNRSDAMKGNQNAKKDGIVEEEKNGKNNIGNQRDGLSDSTGEIRGGGSEGSGDKNVQGDELGDNGNTFTQLPRESGIGLEGAGTTSKRGRRTRRHKLELEERLTKKTAKEIRKACLDLLASKTDEQMTEEDKALLRRYEGAGGLKEKGTTSKAVLTEFYTPHDVINKVWELVDKYNPSQTKKVLEPSSGIGRFAEGRNDDFTLCEIDSTSSRIARILHPKAEVKEGAFQNFFIKNNSVQKQYKGEKYDVVIGNPPYGTYNDYYKGLGEGSIHDRYEQYFIDRGLDTLKDGGIMAFVVPSGFLRGVSSKGKEAIAQKGKLLEAWRLPKGTFSSTDVGTDIVIIKKEKGNIEDFTNNKYFIENERHVIGHEEDGGNWGTKIVKLPEGKTIEDAIAMIDPQATKVEAEIEEAKAKTEIKAIPINVDKINYTVGKLEIGSKILTKDGLKGVVIYAEDGYIGFKLEDGRLGRNKVEEFVVVNNEESAEEEHKNRSEAMMGNQNAKKDFHKEKEIKRKIKKGDLFEASIGKNMTADEFNKKYNKNIREEDLKFWKKTDWEGLVLGLNDKELNEIKNNDNFIWDFSKHAYTNIANYASGNIYEKLEELEKDKEKGNIGNEEYNHRKELLNKVLPTPKKLGEFTLSPLENFANKKEANGLSLVDEFISYCDPDNNLRYENLPGSRNFIPSLNIPHTLSSDVVGDTTMRDVIDYIHRKPIKTERLGKYATDEDKQMAKLEAEKRRQDRKETAERMFNTWLSNLSNEEKEKIEDEWNRISNAFVNPDYTAIPLFVEGMNTHKGKEEFNLTEQQIKGVSQLCNKGNGILAYDVGVGKTVTGLIATINQLQTGKSKKPLICVPKAVYKNWIASAKQHFPDVKINELSNFSQKDLAQYMEDGKLELPENALNICTYEALQKITFKDNTVTSDLRDDILETQSAGDYDVDGNLIPDSRSDREKAKLKEKVDEILGIGVKAKDGAVFFEDLGIDHITVDELHNFKNVFAMPKARKQSTRYGVDDKAPSVADEYSGVQKGTQSDRGMKLFAISQLIQRKTEGKGFFGLSATPFNNSPVEIYNILSLTARSRLKELHIYNLQDFMTQFAELKNDWKVNAKGDVTSEQVMKNFKNLGALQNLITEYIDKVDGEEAGVIRPYKRVHKPMLDLTPVQQAIIKAEMDRMDGHFSKGGKQNKGEVLVAINNMRFATLSPSLIDPKFYKDYANYEGFQTPKDEDVVKGSPKLKFVCDTTATQYNKRPKEGQVIYMPYGVEHFSQVKAYLVSKGMPENSIAFMDAKTSQDKKEAIKSDFNDPDGKIKVIIGSGTIKEGVNLNGNTTTIYNTMLGWNPTETTQVEGRIWRQGNKQGVTHIMYPLMNDSIDAMMYQKYDEKSSRLNALWSYKGDSLNVEDINPEELKFELIKDPEKRANLRILQEKAEIESDIKLLNHKIDSLYYTNNRISELKSRIDDYDNNMKMANKSLDYFSTELNKLKQNLKNAEGELKKEPTNEQLKADIERLNTSVELYNNRVIGQKKAILDYNNGIKKIKKEVKGLTESLEKQGLNNPDDIEARIKNLGKQKEELSKEIDSINDKKEQYQKDAEESIRKERDAVVHDSIDNIVSHYVNEIAGDLKSFDTVKEAIKEIRGYTSTQVQKIIDEVKKNGKATVGGDTFTQRDLKDLEHFKSRSLNKAINSVLVRMGLKKSFNKGEHPRDEEGKFTDSESNSKSTTKEDIKNKLSSWANKTIFEEAEGLSREEIFQKYTNSLEPIAYIDHEKLKLFDPIKDSYIYCGKAYFIDHMVNQHPELDIEDYQHIQEILDEPENIYLDNKINSIVFEKEYKGRKEFVVLRKDENNKIVLHKTFYYGKKVPKRFEKIRPEEQGVTSVDGNPTISHLEKSKPDSPRLSVRDVSVLSSELKKKSRLKKALIEIFKFLGTDEWEAV